MLVVVRNTYPRIANVAHAEVGDECFWERRRGQMCLVRKSDAKVVFSRDLISPGQHDGERPVVGVIASVPSKGLLLELATAPNTATL